MLNISKDCFQVLDNLGCKTGKIGKNKQTNNLHPKEVKKQCTHKSFLKQIFQEKGSLEPRVKKSAV